MRNKICKRVAVAALAVVLSVTTCIMPSFALVKQVKVWGAMSINDMGNSDNLITMQELKDDYSNFLQTDGLTEYFHQDKEQRSKVDLGEALSWLISNEIINRDISVTVANASVSLNNIPMVNINQIDSSKFLYKGVNRSDALMYIYKSVFGPVDARTVGVEATNVRVDNGTQMTLQDIFYLHDYYKTIEAGNVGGIYQLPAGDGTGGTGGVITEGGMFGGAGGQGTGGQGQSLTTAIDTSSVWRYTPQGDEYTSIWGDTNIFISDIDVDQKIDTDGGPGGDNAGGGGGGVGGSNQAVQIEADYKQIYFTLGADLLFYRTNDVLEVYLQSAMDKGLLGRTVPYRTELFNDTFVGATDTTRRWSKYATPFIVNRTRSKLRTAKESEPATLSNVLGTGYTLAYTGGNFTVTRNNPFASNSGYFKDERLTKMEVYQFIYDFIYANEKKLSDLEVEILNFKYGTELQNSALPNDVPILQYLIAVGILDFDNFEDFQRLYEPLIYSEFIPLLYRVANKDARLDFSKIQLTDSEKAWQAAGFAQTTLYVTSETTASPVTYEYTEEYIQKNGNPDMEGTNPAGSPEGDTPDSPLAIVRTFDIGDGYKQVALGNPMALGVKLRVQVPLKDILPHYYSCSLTGLLNANLDTIDTWITDTMLEWYDMSMAAGGTLQYSEIEDLIKRGFTRKMDNIFIFMALQSEDLSSKQLKELIEEKWEGFAAMRGDALSLQALRNVKEAMLAKVDSIMRAGTGSGSALVDSVSVKYRVGSDVQSATKISALPGDDWQSKVKYLAQNLVSIDARGYYKSGPEWQTMWFSIVPTAQGTFNGVTNSDTPESAVSIVDNSTFVYSIGFSMKNAEENSISDLQAVMAATTASQAAQTAVEEDRGLVGYSNKIGTSGYVSWQQILTYNSRVSAEDRLPLSLVSELVMQNTDTNTRAYFSANKDYPIATVGTDVIQGDHDRGVAYRDGSGTSATLWYSIDVIRLLLNAKQEAAVFSGVTTLSLAEESVQRNLKNIPLDTEGSVNTSNVVGIKFLMEADDAAATANNEIGQNSVYFGKNSSVMYGGRWGRYISLSQSNRAMNVISRRVAFTTKISRQPAVGYIIVRFEPTNLAQMGAGTVNTQTTLQGLLDSAVQPPSTPEGQQTYNSYKQRCNEFCNWVYGTTGSTYIETGYLVPRVNFYVRGITNQNELPDSLFAGLSSYSTGLVKAGFKTLNQKDTGAVCPFDSVIPASVGAGYLTDYGATYYMSSDYEVVDCGNRIYMHVDAYPNISVVDYRDGFHLMVSNAGSANSVFQVGGTFKLEQSHNTSFWLGDTEPTATVVKRESDGTITCQYGPIVGFPVRSGASNTYIINPDYLTADKSFRIGDIKDQPIGVDRMAHVKGWFSTPGLSGTTVKRICSKPLITSERTVYVYTLDKVSTYESGKQIKSAASVRRYTAEPGTQTIQDYYADTVDAVKGSGWVPSDTHTYIEFEFSAFEFTIRNGVLVKSTATAADFLSPDLFYNINDLIIDDMIDASKGAIPVNTVPNGALIQIGQNYYCAETPDGGDTKVFVGYSQLPIVSAAAYVPTLQDACISFAGHNIRAGNQYVNVSHFMTNVEYLPPSKVGKVDKVSDNPTTYYAALETIKNVCFTAKGTYYWGVPWAGSNEQATVYQIQGPGGKEAVLAEKLGTQFVLHSRYYAPILFRLHDSLMAYPITSEGEAVQKYALINHTNNNMAGALNELPFFTESVLNDRLNEATTSMMMSGFKINEEAPGLYKLFLEEFEKAFAGDLFTLARLILFVVLIWLFVISWVCFIFHQGRLMPIVDAIRHPVRNGGEKGIDLFKIISLGTISVDTEFKLGRMLQYDAIIAVLILVVWKSGALATLI